MGEKAGSSWIAAEALFKQPIPEFLPISLGGEDVALKVTNFLSREKYIAFQGQRANLAVAVEYLAIQQDQGRREVVLRRQQILT